MCSDLDILGATVTVRVLLDPYLTERFLVTFFSVLSVRAPNKDARNFNVIEHGNSLKCLSAND